MSSSTESPATYRPGTWQIHVDEQDHVWLIGEWMSVDVTDLKARHDRYYEALELIARDDPNCPAARFWETAQRALRSGRSSEPPSDSAPNPGADPAEHGKDQPY